MNIKNKDDLIKTLIEGSTTSLGGYPKYWLTKDGSCLCYKCLAPGRALGGVALMVNPSATDALDNPGSDWAWEVLACDVNYEDPWLFCDNCNKRLPSAYAEDLHQALDTLHSLDINGWCSITDGSMSHLSYDEQLEIVEKAIEEARK